MTCRETIALLSEYLDATLAPEVAAALERHLEGCAPCVAYLNTLRKTRELTRAAALVEMPDEMRTRLREFLATRLRAL
jgi:anti-sigma factor RsiW